LSFHNVALSDLTQRAAPDPHLGAGRRLLENGHINAMQFFYAKQRLKVWDATFTEVLLSNGWVTETQALDALAAELQTDVIDLEQAPPDTRFRTLLRPEICLKFAVVPWIETPTHVILATSRPEMFERLRPHLPAHCRLPHMVLAPEAQIQQTVARLHRTSLTEACEMRVSHDLSCRGWASGLWQRVARVAAFTASLLAVFSLMPDMAMAILVAITLLFLMIGITMKCVALSASRTATQALFDHQPMRRGRLPRISVLVPLFRETEIANALIRRLCTLTYPRALLDVVLVLEEKDQLTQNTLTATTLPDWMRVVIVPTGRGVTTKPRAMNYALDFCRGDIIGIWDAEDAPDPSQLETIATHFSNAASDVACVQGVLDYYNPDTTGSLAVSRWNTRCGSGSSCAACLRSACPFRSAGRHYSCAAMC
jgi:hypothetical protein